MILSTSTTKLVSIVLKPIASAINAASLPIKLRLTWSSDVTVMPQVCEGSRLRSDERPDDTLTHEAHRQPDQRQELFFQRYIRRYCRGYSRNNPFARCLNIRRFIITRRVPWSCSNRSFARVHRCLDHSAATRDDHQARNSGASQIVGGLNRRFFNASQIVGPPAPMIAG